MPELPEVEVVRRGLAPFVTGARVVSVDVREPRSLRRHPGPVEDFVARLTGARLATPQRRGKFLWIPIALEPLPESAGYAAGNPTDSGNGRSDEAVLVHLGMSGQVLVDTSADDRHLRVRIGLEDGTRIDFADQRIFGGLAIDPMRDGVPAQVAHIARDPLDIAFSVPDFVRRLRAKRTEVKRALLDQTLVSGIGNIYADEALWAARVHPRQPTETLSAVAAGRILAETRRVMLRALEEGGTSFDAMYVNVNGRSGYFERSLRAYGRGGQACERCGRPIRREAFMNRRSHFCGNCQRIR